jgi:uncharacterized membrane protein YvbJ
MFCKRCGNELLDHYVFCIKCGMAVRNVELGLASSVVPRAPLKSRIVYVILALFLVERLEFKTFMLAIAERELLS